MEKDWLGSWRKPGAGGCVDSNAREYSKKEKKRKRSMVSKTDEYPHFFLMFINIIISGHLKKLFENLGYNHLCSI